MEKILLAADVKINGNRPWDIQVKNNNFYRQLLAGGSLALGESYMAGWWDAASPDEFICRILKADIKKHAPLTAGVLWDFSVNLLTNRQSIGKSFNIGKKHYDIGNDLYAAMLDKRLIYTCGYWPKAANLDEAQEAKLNLVCRKIGLEKGMRVLDIGCGWGSFAKFAAEKYGAEIVGITVSKQQIEFARENTKGLPIELRLQDYREVTGSFDRVVSLGMFEHVGYKNYALFMHKVHDLLKDDGLFLLHTIGANVSARTCDPWITKYIFPGGYCPALSEVMPAIEHSGLWTTDIEVWRLHYRYLGASGSPDLLPSGSILYGASMTTVGNGRMEIKSLGTIPSFNFSSSPCAKTSTLPSAQFFTHPASPKSSACFFTYARKPTAWT